MGSEVRNTTVVAAVLSLLSVVAFYWWFHPSWLLLAAFLALAIIATLTVPLVYRLAGYTLADEVDWLERREAQEHDQMLQRLSGIRSELEKLGSTTGVHQSDKLVAILKDYHNVVETRFIGKKHSPLAYLTTARRVQKLALENLNDAVAVGHSISSLSRHGTDGSGEELHSDANREARLDGQMSEQKERLNRLHTENRDLFDALTDTAVEVANIQSVSEFDRLDTLARLVSLSEIASRSGSA